eukprot:TRINITY_DN4516_c0_g1_i1.p1 TRINITY_DN4516_c0_g1~~TRINITY_DN4516_c0_g1_i1.p1  ORF type:complete len:448 (+),score=119.33 TRINITY_DN4516_c0_g1_i1:58-1401(+)
MGLVASMFGGVAASCCESLACCVGASACRLCCSCCPSTTNSTSTRIVYAVLFFLSAVSAWVMLDHSVSKGLLKMDKYVGKAGCHSEDEECLRAWGELGVMRVMFGIAVFHAFMALVTIGVKSSKDPRSALHNGLWLFKLIMLVGAMVGAFFIDNTFFIAWGWIGLVGAFLFMLVQFILLVDFAYSWNDAWLNKAEEGSKCAGAGLVLASFGMYIASLVITILLYIYYAQSDEDACHNSKFFISFNLVLATLVTFASVHPRVREARPSSGILQSGLVIFYATYLTWSAVSGVPNSCSGSNNSNTAAVVVGALLTFVSVAYSSIRNSSNTQLGKLGMANQDEESIYLRNDDDMLGDDDDEKRGQQVVDNEKEGVAYSWSFFHLSFVFAAFYLMEVLTEWSTFHDGQNADVHIGRGWASVWIQVVSSWIIMLLYFWSLVAPVCLPDRDFD